MEVSGLGIFLGIVTGAIVQLIAYYFILWRNNKNAEKLLKVEIQYNISRLEELEKDIRDIKDLASTQSLGQHDHYVNMRLFSYNMMKSLMDRGWIHKILTDKELKTLYGFWNQFNAQIGDVWYREFHNRRVSGDYTGIVRYCQTAIKMIKEKHEEMNQIALRF